MSDHERALRPLISPHGLVVGWHCLGCAWQFAVRVPRPLPDYDRETLRVVERLFEAHDCANYVERATAASSSE